MTKRTNRNSQQATRFVQTHRRGQSTVNPLYHMD
nr:MAG TPA: hypothetical protein [Caudoviricetes sp.]